MLTSTCSQHNSKYIIHAKLAHDGALYHEVHPHNCLDYCRRSCMSTECPVLPDIITIWICFSTSGSCRCMLLSFLMCLLAMQIYLMLSCCPCEGHIAGIVDAPNCCCTLAIPIAIFDQVSPPYCALSSPVSGIFARVMPAYVHTTMQAQV